MDIKKFNDYLSDLNESLNSDITINWIDKGVRHIGLFKINENVYQLDFNLEGDVWSYKFYYVRKDDDVFLLDTSITNFKYESFKVLSTAKKGLIKFISKFKPNAIIFSASNEVNTKKIKSGDIELTKRQHIYQQILINTIDIFPEYRYTINNVSDNQIYIIYKEELEDKDYTFSNIEKIINDYIDF